MDDPTKQFRSNYAASSPNRDKVAQRSARSAPCLLRPEFGLTLAFRRDEIKPKDIASLGQGV